MKFNKILSMFLIFIMILGIFGTSFAVSAASKPKTPSIRYISSRAKGICHLTFDTLANSSKIKNTLQNSQYMNAGLCDGYQMAVSTDKSFDNVKKSNSEYKIACWGRVSAIAIGGLKTGKTYYAKLRSYNLDGDKKIYSSWSDIYSVKIASKNDPEINIDNSHDKKKKCGGMVPCALCYKLDGTGYNDTCKYVFNEGCKHYGSRNTEKVKLSKPKSVKKVENYKSLKISWKSVKNADGYQIKYSTNKSFKNAEKELVSGKDETSINLTGLKGNKKYYVKVRAYISTGTNSKKYGSYSSVITGISKVTKPSGVKVTAGKNKITIKYDDIEGYNEIYQIKYSTNKSFKNAKFVTTKKFKKTINNLKSNKTYYIKIKAKTLDAVTDKVVSTSAYTKTFKCKTK